MSFHRMQVDQSRPGSTVMERLMPCAPRSGLPSSCVSYAVRAAASSCAWWTGPMAATAVRHSERGDDGISEPLDSGLGHQAVGAERHPGLCVGVRAADGARWRQ
jgi:hypothetical protein